MIINRILTAFNKNIGLEKRAFIWDYCINIIKNTELNDQNLESFANNNLRYGIFGGNIPELNRRTIIKLADALGVTGIMNPEGIPHNLRPKSYGLDYSDSDLLRVIELKLGFKLDIPEFIGNLNVQGTNYGIVTEKHCFYLWILKKIIELCPDRNAAIIEIGAGIGLLAYFLDKQGYYDYTSIDLSYSNAIQAYFINRNLPERKIILSGEVENPHNLKYKKHIKVLHSSDFHDIAKDRYSIMINIDGLTEMYLADARKYFDSNCADLLLSINHEVNDFRVVELSGNIKKLIYRYPFWLRDGYVEELYKAL